MGHVSEHVHFCDFMNMWKRSVTIAKYANGLFYLAVMRVYDRKFSVTPSTPLLALKVIMNMSGCNYT